MVHVGVVICIDLRLKAQLRLAVTLNLIQGPVKNKLTNYYWILKQVQHDGARFGLQVA